MAKSQKEKVYRNHWQKQWRRKNPDKAKERDRKVALKRNFGITLDEYDNFLKNQNFLCILCQNPETFTYNNTETIRRLSIDHDHRTGLIRGLLCNKCNILIGQIETNNIFNLNTYLNKIREYLNYAEK